MKRHDERDLVRAYEYVEGDLDQVHAEVLRDEFNPCACPRSSVLRRH